MVKIDDFHVEFREKWALYHPGETLNGRVLLKLNDTILCDAVTVTLYGSARVFWVEREPQGSVAYTSEKVYFNDKQQIWTYQPPTPTKDSTNDRETRPHLPAGRFEFDFTYTLPQGLPTSFDAKHSSGYVRYFAKVCVTNQDTIKHSRKAYFSVVKPEDLNLYPALYSSSTRHNVKRCKANFCSSSSTANRYISLGLRLPKLGFVPGEQIKFSVDVDNRSKRSVHSVKAHLIQQVTAYATTPSFKLQDAVKVVVSVGKVEKFPKGSLTVWNDTPLYIPAVVPTFVIDDVLEVHYSLRIEAYCDKHAAEVAVEIPITVGTVPLVNDNNVGVVPRGLDPPPAYDNYTMEIRKLCALVYFMCLVTVYAVLFTFLKLLRRTKKALLVQIITKAAKTRLFLDTLFINSLEYTVQ